MSSPYNDGSLSDAGIAGRISLVASTATEMDDTITGNSGIGRQGVT